MSYFRIYIILCSFLHSCIISDSIIKEGRKADNRSYVYIENGTNLPKNNECHGIIGCLIKITKSNPIIAPNDTHIINHILCTRNKRDTRNRNFSYGSFYDEYPRYEGDENKRPWHFYRTPPQEKPNYYETTHTNREIEPYARALRKQPYERRSYDQSVSHHIETRSSQLDSTWPDIQARPWPPGHGGPPYHKPPPPNREPFWRDVPPPPPPNREPFWRDVPPPPPPNREPFRRDVPPPPPPNREPFRRDVPPPPPPNREPFQRDVPPPPPPNREHFRRDVPPPPPPNREPFRRDFPPPPPNREPFRRDIPPPPPFERPFPHIDPPPYEPPPQRNPPHRPPPQGPPQNRRSPLSERQFQPEGPLPIWETPNNWKPPPRDRNVPSYRDSSSDIDLNENQENTTSSDMNISNAMDKIRNNQDMAFEKNYQNSKQSTKSHLHLFQAQPVTPEE